MPSYVWTRPRRKTDRMKRIALVVVLVALAAGCWFLWRADSVRAKPAAPSMPPGEQNCIIESTPDGGKRAMCWDVHPGQRV